MAKTPSYRVILLGERNVGKTSLFRALKDIETEVQLGECAEMMGTASRVVRGRERTLSVISTAESQIDTCTKVVELGSGQRAVLQFCDTAGHVKVNSFMPQYYRKARLILLVYSRDDDGTLRALDNWIDNAKKFLQDTRSSYSFCLVGLYSSHFLELHPPLTYDEKKVTQETLDNFLSHHYLNENLIFEVNLDTKEGLEELLMKLGRATKKLKSAPVGEVSTFTLSDTFDTTTATNVSQSGTPVKLQSASRKGPDADSERCC